MRRKYKIELVNTPENLRQFSGWEVRKVYTRDSPGIVLQNPDTGEKRKLIISRLCFDGSSLQVSRRANYCAQINTQKKG